jgi:hypothetical protein
LPTATSAEATAGGQAEDVMPELMHDACNEPPVQTTDVDADSGFLHAVDADVDGAAEEAAAEGDGLEDPGLIGDSGEVLLEDGLSDSGSSCSDDGSAQGAEVAQALELNDVHVDVSLEVAYQITALQERSARSPPAKADTSKVYRHLVRMTIHYGHLENDDLTGCGRAISDKHEQVVSDPSDLWPKSRGCFPL